MKKILFILAILLLNVTLLFSQGFTTKSKKAIEYYNLSKQAFTKSEKIEYLNNKLVYYEDDKIYNIDESAPVSVNLFGFTPKVFIDAEEYFKEFLKENSNDLKKEFYLPTIVQKSIDDNKADVTVLHTTSKFNGMTYKEDLEQLKENINELISDGVYPENLWGE